MATATDAKERPPAEPPASSKAPRVRDHYFDNAKFGLMLVVVFGHVFRQLFSDGGFYRPAYIWIYLFHMPAFVLVSGYFSKASMLDARRVERAIRTLLVPYLIFEAINTWFFYELFSRDDLSFTLLSPSWRMWFILSLFLWRVLMPYVLQMRYPLASITAIAVLAGYMPNIGGFLSLSRTLGMFPFFILGYQLKQHHFVWLRKPLVRVVSVLVLVATGLIVWQWTDFDPAWTWFRFPYSAFGWDGWTVGWTRLAASGGALIVGGAFLSLMPARKGWYTSLGTRTLYAYILHGFLVQWAKAEGLFDNVEGFTAHALIIVGSVVGTIVVSSKWVEDLARPLFEPPLDWLFRRREASEPPVKSAA